MNEISTSSLHDVLKQQREVDGDLSGPWFTLAIPNGKQLRRIKTSAFPRYVPWYNSKPAFGSFGMCHRAIFLWSHWCFFHERTCWLAEKLLHFGDKIHDHHISFATGRQSPTSVADVVRERFRWQHVIAVRFNIVCSRWFCMVRFWYSNFSIWAYYCLWHLLLGAFPTLVEIKVDTPKPWKF